MVLQLGDAAYAFLPHPVFPDDPEEVSVVEGGEAFIYQVREVHSSRLYALKVSKPSCRGEQIAQAVAALAPYSHLPGLTLGNRLCLTRAQFPELIARYPDLELSVLMPWLDGTTWAGFMADRLASANYAPSQARGLATLTAQVLWNLEAYHLAHTDVAGGNLILSPDLARVELLDLDNLYLPQAPVPHYMSHGTPGYQHPHLGPHGQWCAEGDRFAGAILLVEMLAWADPLVRAQTPEGADSLFQPHELQATDSPRWEAVRDALWEICPPALDLFDEAWASADLSECPELGSWALALLQAQAQG